VKLYGVIPTRGIRINKEMKIMTNDPEKMIPESQLKLWLAEALLDVAQGLGAKPGNRKTYPTTKAYKLLGYDDPDQLRNAVATGLLRLGKEVEDRRTPRSKIARYYLDISACQSRLSERPEKRKPT
jgi:hypothetical protein